MHEYELRERSIRLERKRSLPKQHYSTAKKYIVILFSASIFGRQHYSENRFMLYSCTNNSAAFTCVQFILRTIAQLRERDQAAARIATSLIGDLRTRYRTHNNATSTAFSALRHSELRCTILLLPSKVSLEKIKRAHVAQQFPARQQHSKTNRVQLTTFGTARQYRAGS